MMTRFPYYSNRSKLEKGINVVWEVSFFLVMKWILILYTILLFLAVRFLWKETRKTVYFHLILVAVILLSAQLSFEGFSSNLIPSYVTLLISFLMLAVKDSLNGKAKVLNQILFQSGMLSILIAILMNFLS